MIENPSDEIFRRDVFRFGLIGDRDTVAQHVVADGLDVLGRHVAAAFEEGVSADGPGQEDRRPRTGAILDIGRQIQAVIARPPGGMDDIDDIALEIVGDIISPLDVEWDAMK